MRGSIQPSLHVAGSKMLLFILATLMCLLFAWTNPMLWKKNSPIITTTTVNPTAAQQSRFQNNPLLSRHVKTPLASSFVCIGGEIQEAWGNKPYFDRLDWSKRLCVLQNIQINGLQVTYFNPASFALPYADNFPIGHPNKLQGNFVQRSEFAREFHMNISFSTKVAPQADKPEVCSIFASCGFGPDGWGGAEPGHDYDALWDVFSDMANMQMLSTSNNVLVLHHCKHISKVWHALADVVMHIDNLPKNLSVGCALFSKPRRSMYEFVKSMASPLHMQVFREFVWERFGIQPPNLFSKQQQHRHKIGVNFKQSRHRFPNHLELIRHLREKYAHCCDVVDLRLPEMTMEQEVRAISQLSVYITPSGGGSFSTVFLPNAAHAVFGSPCWPGGEKRKANAHGVEEFEHLTGKIVHCYRMENYIWSHLPYFHQHYLSADRVEGLVYDRAKPSQFGLPRNIGYSFNVSFPVIDRIIDNALQEYNV